MKLIEQSNIDRTRWDQLVSNDENASIYNQSIFLDKLAENWSLLIDDDYSVGLPVPFTIRLGVKGIYTPNFIRTLDWVGLNGDNKKLVLTQSTAILKSKFKLCQLRMLTTPFIGMNSELVFQKLSFSASLNSQAKRSIKKFEKSNLKIQEVGIESILPIITEELGLKVAGVKEIDLNRFESLLKNYPSSKLTLIGVSENDCVLGGLIFIRWKDTLHYVKGGVRKEAKHNGAMYAMMDAAIKIALKENLIVDFGGSNVSGVRQFNCSFGAEDVHYSEWKWDHSPLWFRCLKSLRIKKS